MKLSITLCTFIFLVSSLHGQTSEYGYIINLKGDTLTGYLSFEESPTIYKEVYFKKRNDEEVLHLKPEDILEFHYINAHITYRAMEYVYKLERGGLRTEIYFAKLLLDGYTNLYKLQFETNPYRKRVEANSFAFDGNNTFIYYLLKEGQEYQMELEERNYYEGDNEYPTSVRKHKRYLTKLHVAFADCIYVQQQLEKVDFNDEELAEIVVKYNRCKDPTGENTSYVEVNKESERVKKDYFGFAGNYHRITGNGYGVSWVRHSKRKAKKWGRLMIIETGLIPQTATTSIATGYASFKFGGQYNFNLNKSSSPHAYFNFGLRMSYEPNVNEGNMVTAPDSEFGLGYTFKNLRIDAYLGVFSYGGRISFGLK